MHEPESENTNANALPTRAARPALRTGERPEVAASAGDALWAVAEVAAYLQLSTHAVYKMTARKASVRIPHIRIGGKLRFRRSDVDRWLSLLTVSNLDTLTKMRGMASKGHHGHDP